MLSVRGIASVWGIERIDLVARLRQRLAVGNVPLRLLDDSEADVAADPVVVIAGPVEKVAAGDETVENASVSVTIPATAVTGDVAKDLGVRDRVRVA